MCYYTLHHDLECLTSLLGVDWIRQVKSMNWVCTVFSFRLLTWSRQIVCTVWIVWWWRLQLRGHRDSPAGHLRWVFNIKAVSWVCWASIQNFLQDLFCKVRLYLVFLNLFTTKLLPCGQFVEFVQSQLHKKFHQSNLYRLNYITLVPGRCFTNTVVTVHVGQANWSLYWNIQLNLDRCHSLMGPTTSLVSQMLNSYALSLDWVSQCSPLSLAKDVLWITHCLISKIILWKGCEWDVVFDLCYIWKEYGSS